MASVTGIAGSQEELFTIGENRDESKPVIVDAFWPLPLPTNPTDIPGIDYYEFNPPIFNTRDIAYENAGNRQIVWIATGEESSPIKAFRVVAMSTQTRVDSVPAAIGIGNDIWGMAFEKSGSSRFIWTNNQKEGKIYKIDLDAQTDIHQSTISDKLFSNSLRITSTAGMVNVYIPFAGKNVVTIVDLQGREICSFTASDGSRWYQMPVVLSPGIHIVRVKSSNERTVIGKLWFVR